MIIEVECFIPFGILTSLGWCILGHDLDLTHPLAISIISVALFGIEGILLYFELRCLKFDFTENIHWIQKRGKVFRQLRFNYFACDHVVV